MLLNFSQIKMDEFSKMNYRDLQKLAKTAGVKANLPKAELLKALRDHAANASLLSDDEIGDESVVPVVNDNEFITDDEVADENVETKMPAVIDSEFITDDEELTTVPSGSGIFSVQFY